MKKILLASSIALLWHAPGNAASFDCAKARTKHEKHICSSPDINAADGRLGDAYRVAAQSFPVKGFVRATQRRFLAEYESCDSQDHPNCATLLAARTQILGTMVNPEAVYADVVSGKSFDPEGGVFWVAQSQAGPVLHYFGGFMPDMFKPAPFPQGFVCDDEIPLRKTAVGYDGSAAGDDVSIIDQKLTASISCSPRNGLSGDFARIH